LNKNLWAEIKERTLRPHQPRAIDHEVAHLVLGAIVLMILWMAVTFVANASNPPEIPSDSPPVSGAFNR
jgi:hypothetical protein